MSMNEKISFHKHDFAIKRTQIWTTTNIQQTKKTTKRKESNPWLRVSITNLRSS